MPVAAALLAVKLNVELPLPGAAIELGLKLAVTPEGRPETESEITAFNPPLMVVEIVLLPEPPWATDKLLGEALKVKSGVGAAVMVSATVVLWVIPPPVALMVTLADPVADPLAAVRVSVELPLPGAAMEVELKLAVTPEGNPEADNDIAELKPPLTVVEIVVLPELP